MDMTMERWLLEERNMLQWQLQSLTEDGYGDLLIDRKSIIVMTIEPALVDSLRQTVNHLRPGAISELAWSLSSSATCRNPPSDEALLATATELAHFVSNSLRHLTIYDTDDISLRFLAACSRLESLRIDDFCTFVPAINRSTLSIPTLRRLVLSDAAFPDSESVNAFCLAMSTSSLESLSLIDASIRPEHVEQVDMTLARCNNFFTFTLRDQAQYL